MAENWTAQDIPDQAGRTAVVTGANSGLGLVAARALAGAGAEVVLACRNAEKAGAAAASIRAAVTAAKVAVEALDLSSLDSIREFAERYGAAHGSLLGLRRLLRCHPLGGSGAAGRRSRSCRSGGRRC